MGRRRKGISWRWRLGALAALAAIAAGSWLWWQVQHWTPDSAEFPDQGVLLAAGNLAGNLGGNSGGEPGVNLQTLRARGASFAYVRASEGADGQNPDFTRQFDNVREAGLQEGAVHLYDPCVMADRQSANFMRMVPRDAGLLPPVVELRDLADDCAERVNEAAVESELLTLINQIENHTGKPVILKISPEFEARYGLARRIERNLWLTRTRFAPEYAGRPWLVWTANEALRSTASDEPLEWVVVRP